MADVTDRDREQAAKLFSDNQKFGWGDAEFESAIAAALAEARAEGRADGVREAISLLTAAQEHFDQVANPIIGTALFAVASSLSALLPAPPVATNQTEKQE